MNQETKYFPLTPETAAPLVDAPCFDNPVDPAQLAAFVADPNHLLIYATQGDAVVGFASGNVLFHPDKPPSFFVNEVGVEDAYRRQGIASELCNRLMDMARARGCEGIWLATETDNAPARALYTSLEARETEGVVVYDWDGAMDDMEG